MSEDEPDQCDESTNYYRNVVGIRNHRKSQKIVGHHEAGQGSTSFEISLVEIPRKSLRSGYDGMEKCSHFPLQLPSCYQTYSTVLSISTLIALTVSRSCRLLGSWWVLTRPTDFRTNVDSSRLRSSSARCLRWAELVKV